MSLSIGGVAVALDNERILRLEVERPAGMLGAPTALRSLALGDGLSGPKYPGLLDPRFPGRSTAWLATSTSGHGYAHARWLVNLRFITNPNIADLPLQVRIDFVTTCL
jgi:hypothetical protein